MVEQDESKSVGREIVRVRFLPRVPSKIQPLGFKTRRFIVFQNLLKKGEIIFGADKKKPFYNIKTT